MDNKLCLGTVQFGLDYGINNRTGRPEKETVFNILDAAVDGGIRCFDTSAAYGDSELILGEYISSRMMKNNIKIISKLKSYKENAGLLSPADFVEKEIKASLKSLNMDFIEGYLLHEPMDFYNKEILLALNECKKKGLVRNTGISVYEAQHALEAVKSGYIDYIQVPYNLLDRRLVDADFFNTAKQFGVTVFARSVLLQGLLLMDENDIPRHLEGVKKHLKVLDRIAGKYNLSRFEAAVLFSYETDGVDFVVFGVDNQKQLTEYLALFNKRIDTGELIEDLNRGFSDVDEYIISPNLWKVNN